MDMLPPPYETSQLSLREWLIGCILSNSSICNADDTAGIAKRAVFIADAVLNQMVMREETPEENNGPISTRVTTSSRDTIPCTPTSITQDKMKAAKITQDMMKAVIEEDEDPRLEVEVIEIDRKDKEYSEDVKWDTTSYTYFAPRSR